MKYQPHLVNDVVFLEGVTGSILYWPNRPSTPFEVVLDVYGQKHRRRFRSHTEAEEYLRRKSEGWR